MADIGSERRRFRLPRRLVRPGRTLRLRLTVLYGACFLVAGAALLGITYALVAHDTGAQTQKLYVKAPSAIGFAGLSSGIVLQSAGIGGADFAQVTSGPHTTVVGTNHPPGSGSHVAIRETPQQQTTVSQQPATVSFRYAGKVYRMSPAAAQRFAQSKLLSARRQTLDQLTALKQRANVALVHQRSASLSSLLTWSGIALGCMAVLSIALGWLLAGRALRPLRTMNARAQAITEESLHERLGLEGRTDELGQLASAFDGLLGRLERAFDAQRRFVANASHELRTPLTLERTLVEVALADPDADADALRHVCERVLASTEQQERLIEALLTLARSQAGVEAGAPVDLADLAGDALLSREARLVGVELETELEPALVTGDAALLERLVVNLVDNAAVHNGDEHRWISVRTGDFDGQPGLRIANGGGVIREESVDQLFEPFHRLDGERTSGAGGLGLGLSIVQAVAIAHGADVSARPLPAGGLEVEVRFAEAGAKPPIGGTQTVASL